MKFRIDGCRAPVAHRTINDAALPTFASVLCFTGLVLFSKVAEGFWISLSTVLLTPFADRLKITKTMIDPQSAITSGTTHCVIETASRLSSLTSPTCRSNVSVKLQGAIKLFPRDAEMIWKIICTKHSAMLTRTRSFE